MLQKDIISYANGQQVKVYVATNLMESMVTDPSPTRAEVNDVFNTLLDGADGLVLAGETAIGSYPVGAALMIRRIIREYEDTRSWKGIERYQVTRPRCIEPHGGRLVNRAVAGGRPTELSSLRTVWATEENLVDCIHIGHGTYSPLTGFMTAEELTSVLDRNRLPDGPAWTVPVVLQVTPEVAREIAISDRIALIDDGGTIRATVEVEEIYSFDLDLFARKCFGTTSRHHPGVERLATAGDRFIAGEVTLLEDADSRSPRFDLRPAQTREMFTQMGWDRVVGYHMREPLRRAADLDELRAATSIPADGLYVSVPTHPASHQAPETESPASGLDLSFLDEARSPGWGESPDSTRKVLLGGLAAYPRHCGAREQVFMALCHKNLGCSHYVIGRPDGSGHHQDREMRTRSIFDELGDVGVVPVFAPSPLLAS